MPSPFPGMDPFLEHPDVFPDLHSGMITFLQAGLKAVLPRPYFASTSRRTWIEVSERHIGPDVNVVRDDGAAPARTAAGAGTGTAVLEPGVAAGVVVDVPHDEMSESFLEIHRDEDGHRRLVTTLEILSLSNKTPGAHGRDLYRRKQRELLESKVHLVEIDLLRAGHHTTAVPLARLRRNVGACDYHVCVHRFDRWQQFIVYPFRVDEPLPRIPIPLLPDDGQVVLDLQSAFRQAYDIGPYDVEIEYRVANPTPPLRPELADWLRQTIAAAFP